MKAGVPDCDRIRRFDARPDLPWTLHCPRDRLDVRQAGSIRSQNRAGQLPQPAEREILRTEGPVRGRGRIILGQ